MFNETTEIKGKIKGGSGKNLSHLLSIKQFHLYFMATKNYKLIVIQTTD
jgi:hypothetical protein